MDDLLTAIFDFFGLLTPKGRNKRKGGEEPVAPFTSLIVCTTLFVVLVAVVIIYLILGFNIRDYIIPAIIIGIIVWVFLYIITVNLVDWLYIKYLKNSQSKKAN